MGRHAGAIQNAQIDLEAAERKLELVVNEALRAGMTYDRAAKALGVSRATLHRRYVQTQQSLRLGS